jgi:hydrogenase expression/formation protein HypE
MPTKVSKIKLAHGGGGILMQELIRNEITPVLGTAALQELTDSARLEVPGSTLAFTTDSYVIQPLFFPGGDIGKIAVCGTINDLAARGAKPIALSLALIIEEGLSLETLTQIVRSVGDTAREAGVEVVTGDTKVVERGAAQEIFITTSGVGLMRPGLDFAPERIDPGDVLILNGSLGDHGIAVMSIREGLSFTTPLQSDVAPLSDLVEDVLDASPTALKCLKDLTRGGLAANLNEIARQVGFILEEEKIPVRPEVRGACDMLGLDVLTVANEGKMLFVAAPDTAQAVWETLRAHPLGKGAVQIGVADDRAGLVRLNTNIGGQRIIDTPYGEELPRIC